MENLSSLSPNSSNVTFGSGDFRTREVAVTISHNILVPIDFSDMSDEALAYARDLAKPFNAALHLFRVVRDLSDAWPVELAGAALGGFPDNFLRAAQQRVDRLDAGNLRHDTITRVGQPHREILQYAKTHNIDLIVMATHGHGPVEHMLLGSVAEKVVRSAVCPVLTVRHARAGLAGPR